MIYLIAALLIAAILAGAGYLALSGARAIVLCEDSAEIDL